MNQKKKLSGIKVSSAKAKGRYLQQWVVQKIKDMFGFKDTDIKSVPGGTQGEDIWMSSKVRIRLPVSVECKNQQRVNIWDAYKQATTNAGNYEPIVVIKKNYHKPLVVVDAEYFLRLFE